VADGLASSGIPTERDLQTCKELGEVLAKAAIQRGEEPKD
jgi:hypothetical protein